MNDRLISATGPIPYGLTNDCMFHFVFQNDIRALKSLVCSVLHLAADDVNEIEVCNPIEIGRAFDSKKFHLDLKVRFNNNTIVNLEMQVMNRGNWPERSLSYLCRSYDNLNKGKDYKDVYGAVHIGFIDFTLFSDEPEFCATYMMSNIKSHRIYSSKFALKVVELNNTNLATDEDRQYGIDCWAKFFKATTWEELKMCAGGNDIMQSAVEIMYEYNEDEAVRDMCREREEAVAFEEFIKEEKARLQAELEDVQAKLKQVEVTREMIGVEKARLESDKERLESDKERLESDKERLKSDKERLESDKERLESDKERLESDNEQLRQEIERLKKMISN